jgi:hypothetical protein
MKKVLTGAAAGVLAFSLFASAAFGAVNLDADSGKGFVGKGEVQSAFGWNNAQLQANAEKVQFVYTTETKYEVTVEWTTGEGNKGEKTHTVTHKRDSSFSSSIAADARRNNQVNGFNLNGFEGAEQQEAPYKAGEIFPGNSRHVITDVNLVSVTNELTVKFGTNEAVLPLD